MVVELAGYRVCLYRNGRLEKPLTFSTAAQAGLWVRQWSDYFVKNGYTLGPVERIDVIQEHLDDYGYQQGDAA